MSEQIEEALIDKSLSSRLAEIWYQKSFKKQVADIGIDFSYDT